MAPFQGVTTSVYRKVYAGHFKGIDKYFTPFFTNIHKNEVNPAKAVELKDVTINGVPVVPQILSKDAEEILRFANYVKSLGFDEINWNLGCPFPRVAKKKRGSGLLPFPEDVRGILDKVMPEIPVKLSVKARLGYESPDEIFSLLPVFNDYNISELTVHARTARQMYKGDVILDKFRELISGSKIPLGYNGDIYTVKDYQKFTAEFTGIDIIMLGRGLLVDPFLPGIIKGYDKPDNESKKLSVKNFVDDLYYEYRKKTNNSLSVLNVLKELWWYLAHSFENPHKVFKVIKKNKRFEEYENAIKEVFDTFEWVGEKADLFRLSRISK